MKILIFIVLFAVVWIIFMTARRRVAPLQAVQWVVVVAVAHVLTAALAATYLGISGGGYTLSLDLTLTFFLVAGLVAILVNIVAALPHLRSQNLQSKGQ